MGAKRKKELRDEMRRVLSSLDDRWQRAASAQVCDYLSKLIGDNLSNKIDHVLAWTSFFPGEVDLGAFILGEVDEREIYLPRSLEDRSMTFISIGKDWVSHSEPGPGGVPQPKSTGGRQFDSALADRSIILVPGLAFDRDGNRLGRGMGYYDRFLGLSSMRRAIRVGVCWTLQVVGGVPADQNDVPMDWIVHEDGFFKTSFGQSEEDEFAL